MVTNSIKPNFLCIGAQKAGTTWLHNNLKQHPQIWLPPYKEIHYFDQIYLDKSAAIGIEKNRLVILKRELNKKINGESLSYSYLKFLADMAFSEVKDDRWYLSLFNGVESQPAVGEITPAYSVLPEVGIRHIKQLLGDINLIYILRNPIRRAWSQVVMAQRSDILQNKQINYENWVEIIDRKYHLLKGHYMKTIDNYEKYFSRDKILYLFYDEICLNPVKLLEKVCDFLDVKYEQQYFDSTITCLVNNNPKIDMPEKVEQYLIQKYKSEEELIRERFKPASFQL